MQKEFWIVVLMAILALGIALFVIEQNKIIYLSPTYNASNNIISSCGNITESGEYIMNQSLNEGEVIPVSGNGCIDIQASDVILDCQENFLMESSLEIAGIYSANTNEVTIKNCNISITNGKGIVLLNVTDSFVEDNVLEGNVIGVEVTSNSRNNIFRRNVISSSSDSAIYLSESKAINISTVITEANTNVVTFENSTENYLFDSNISDSNINIIRMIDGSSLVVLNTTYDKDKEELDSLSRIKRNWYLDINTKNNFEGFLDSVNVTLYNTSGGVIYSALTNEFGLLNNLRMPEYENSGGSRIDYSNYVINISRDNAIANSSILVLNENKKIILILAGNVGPIINWLSPRNGREYTATGSHYEMNFSLNIDSVNGVKNCSVYLNGSDVDVFYINNIENNSRSTRTTNQNLDEGEYNASVSCFDLLDYQKNSSVISFKIIPEEEDTEDDNNDDPDDQPQEFWTNTYIVGNNETANGTSKGLGARERLRITVGGGTHHIGVISLTTNSAVINVSSVTQQARFNIGETKRFELSDDAFYDLNITLNSITDSKANITLLPIHEPIQGVINNTNATVGNFTGNDTDSDENDQNNSEVWTISTKRIVLVSAVLVSLIVIIVLIWFLYHRKRENSRWRH